MCCPFIYILAHYISSLSLAYHPLITPVAVQVHTNTARELAGFSVLSPESGVGVRVLVSVGIDKWHNVYLVLGEDLNCLRVVLCEFFDQLYRQARMNEQICYMLVRSDCLTYLANCVNASCWRNPFSLNLFNDT